MSGPPNRDPPPLAEQFNPCLGLSSIYDALLLEYNIFLSFQQNSRAQFKEKQRNVAQRPHVF